MTDGPTYPNTKLNKYPHMFPLDIPIWERFLDQSGADFLGFDYDVKVGSGTEPVEGLGVIYARMQSILSKYRIDVVGYKSGAIWIIETKPEAGTVAIGQIEAYTRLYTRDMSPKLPVVGCIITNRALPDMEYLTKEKGIEYYVV
jgi:hypothetical protein